MKKTVLTVMMAGTFALGTTMLAGCGGGNKAEQEHSEEMNHHEHAEGEEGHHDGDHHDGAHHENTAVFEGKKVKDLSLILDSYFLLKNALVKDDAKSAAQASKKLLGAFNGFDTSSVDAPKLKEYMEITDNAVENAEHISENGDNIDHQREHLVSLSEDINDLIVLIGSDQKLYQAYCPMANDGKGATWISEIKEIQNPYMGSKMPKCGKVQKEL